MKESLADTKKWREEQENSTEWQKTKQRVRNKVDDLADKLNKNFSNFINNIDKAVSDK